MNPLANPVFNVVTIMPVTAMQFWYVIKMIDMKRKNLYFVSCLTIIILVMYLNCIGIVNNAFRVFFAILLILFYPLLFIEKNYIRCIIWNGLNIIISECCEGISAVFVFCILKRVISL